MVRVKERYLLVNILYPEAARNSSNSNLPDILVYNQPTTDAFTARVLSQAVKAEVTNLFGDYGAGTVERTLRGMRIFCLPSNLSIFIPSPVATWAGSYPHTA